MSQLEVLISQMSLSKVVLYPMLYRLIYKLLSCFRLWNKLSCSFCVSSLDFLSRLVGYLHTRLNNLLICSIFRLLPINYARNLFFAISRADVIGGAQVHVVFLHKSLIRLIIK